MLLRAEFTMPCENFFPSYPPKVLHEPLIDEDPVFIATCTERELRKRKKRKFSLWVRQCSSTGFIIQVSQGLCGGGERRQKWGLLGICGHRKDGKVFH